MRQDQNSFVTRRGPNRCVETEHLRLELADLRSEAPTEPPQIATTEVEHAARELAAVLEVKPGRPGPWSRLARPSTLALVAALLSPPACVDCDDQCNDLFYASFEKTTPWETKTYDVQAELPSRVVNCTFTFPNVESSLCDDDDAFVSHNVFRYYGAPKEVDLRISLDGVLLAEESFDPAYEGTQGWDRSRCGPPCDEAGVTMAIP